MSSSNLVRLAYIQEATYGVTPGSGNFKTARFTQESLSGTPDTTESQQIRVDRQSSGQVVTGMQVGGGLNFELAKEAALEDFMASAMHNAWNTMAPVTRDFDIDATAKTITAASGSFISDGLKKGDIIVLAGVAPGNAVPIMLKSVSALELEYIGPAGMTDETGSGSSYKRADKLTIGVTKRSFSMEKAFLDLTNKAVLYRGMIASAMNINTAHGALINGSFTFVGNDHVVVDEATDFMTNGRTIDPAATTSTLNGSIDMPFIGSGAAGAFGDSDFALRSVELGLNNNMTPQPVIGDIAPVDYSSGTAQITMSLNAYLNDNSWQVLGKKLTQEPFELGFMVKNLGGWYGFYLPAVQVSFPDPSSGGQNQDVMLEMNGTAKVGANGESALTIFRVGT